MTDRKVKKGKTDRTLVLTSVLLFLMLVAGIGSGILGFASGHAALKGVTQPDIRPNSKPGTLKNEGVNILKESDIIAQVKRKISVPEDKEKTKNSKDSKDLKDNKDNKDNKDLKADQSEPKKSPEAQVTPIKLPATIEDQGIKMVVRGVKTEGNQITLNLGLKNSGSQVLKLGQGLLTLNNEQGKTIEGKVVGLPENLVANGKEVNVKVSLDPKTLEDGKTISLQLTDAEKKLQLGVSRLPVKQ